MPIKPPKSLVKRKSFIETLSLMLMDLNRDHLTQLIVSLVVTSLALLLLAGSVLQRFETVFLDLMFRTRPPILASHNIVYVQIAEDSLQAIKERPWPRHYHGIVLDVLKNWGARAVLFDYLFEGPSTEFDDGVFEESLQKNKGVYFPVFVESVSGQKILLRSLSRFEKYVQGIGHINVNPDDDGILRRFKPFVEMDGKFYPHIGMKLANDLLKKPFEKPADLPFKLDRDGYLLISWPGKWTEAFDHFSYVDVLKSFESIENGNRPIIQPEKFKDKIVLIGHTAAGGTDIKATPMDKAYPGVGVIASIVNGTLLGEFIVPATFHQNMFALLVMGFLSIVFFLPFRNLVSPLAGVFLIAGWIGFAYFMFVVHRFWLNVFQPAQLVLVLFIFSAFFSKIASDRERLRFYKLSTTDGLTEVAVRRYFDVMAERMFKTAKRFKLPLSIVLIDIDFFKKVNDTYGHQAGDAVLRKVAGLIRDGIRYQGDQADGDIVARFGGEEFALLLPYTDLKTASFNVADRIRKAIEVIPIEYEDQLIPVTVSLGVASLHDFDESPESIIRRADEALYRSKENGRNRTSIETFSD